MGDWLQYRQEIGHMSVYMHAFAQDGKGGAVFSHAMAWLAMISSTFTGSFAGVRICLPAPFIGSSPQYKLLHLQDAGHHLYAPTTKHIFKATYCSFNSPEVSNTLAIHCSMHIKYFVVYLNGTETTIRCATLLTT